MGTQKTRRKVLAVAYGGGHAQILIPIIQELKRREIDVTFLALTIAGPRAQAEGIPHKKYIDYAHLMDLPRVIPLGTELAKTMHNPDSGMELKESIHYLGVNMAEAIECHGEAQAWDLWSKVGRHIFLPIHFLTKIIQSERPDLVLTTNSPKSEKAALIAARALGIPSVRVEDLFIETNLIENLKQILGNDTYERTLAVPRFSPSRVAVMCDFSKEIFATKGRVLGMDVPQEHVLVTGQPILEAIDSLMLSPPAAPLFPNRPEFPTIVWAQEGGTADEAAVQTILSTWQRHADEFNLVVKVHPNTAPADLVRIRSLFDSQKSGFRVIHREIDPNTILWNSSVLVAQESTMLTQAVYMGRPVVILDPENRRPDSAYVRMGVGLFARSVVELNQILTAASDPKSSLSLALAEARKSAHFEKQGTLNIAELCETLI